MHGKWQLINDVVILKAENGTVFFPNAEQIFLAEFRQKPILGEVEVGKPSTDIRCINFSKYPLDLIIRLEPSTNKEKLQILLTLAAKSKKGLISADEVFESGRDYIIIEETLFPLLSGAIEEMKNILNKAHIEKIGYITLHQYCLLKSSNYPNIIDELQQMSIDKNQLISKDDCNIPGFVGSLYPYQVQGFRWLKMIVDENAGCILADEMGLGKTAQVIAVLLAESFDTNFVSLVVAPSSLLENWKREIQKFAPTLRFLVHQGSMRTGYYTTLNKFDVIITSYDLIVRDLSIFKMIHWNIVIADEAQSIKNPLALRTSAAKQLIRNSSIAVTGTPIENTLTDLWSIADFVFPGYLGKMDFFQKKYSNEINSAKQIEPLISPILLRRRVKNVAADLPPRVNIPQALMLSEYEAQLYDSFRTKIIAEYGKSASLVSLIKLRMFCTHPLLIDDLTLQDDPIFFGKYRRLTEILEEIISNNEKVIIFTSYTKMTDILLKDLRNRFNVYCDFIDGRVGVPERQTKIDTFSNIKESAILVLNPKAAGVGLNITAANHAIHYNLEWNPAIEDQGSARVYRRGQTRPVTIYRLFYANTVEEIINERLDKKRDLSNTAIIGTDGTTNDKSDIIRALMKSPLLEGSEHN